jgi:putative hydrolase of the HAD superfamily
MIPTSIRAVVFDMGGTLEEIYFDDDLRLRATRGLQAILACQGMDPRMDVPRLYATVTSGLKAYQDWREASEQELPSARVWNEFVFAGCDLEPEKVATIAEGLSLFYESHFFQRSLRPEAPRVLQALQKRGLRLAIISNVISLRLVPESVLAYGLAHFFEAIVTSSELGTRKPNPLIFQEAARQLNLAPASCAYVGDTVSRDVVGARRAGYGLALQIKSFLTDQADRNGATESPDAVIENLMQVLDVVGRKAEQDA